MYDPTNGRFTSDDSITDTNNPQQINGYAYANNNPTSARDPSGLMLAADSGGGGCNTACMKALDKAVAIAHANAAKAAAKARAAHGAALNNQGNAIDASGMPLASAGHAEKGLKDIKVGQMSKEMGLLRRGGYLPSPKQLMGLNGYLS
jgi:hypothetical protein